jgi:hypothetical protein
MSSETVDLGKVGTIVNGVLLPILDLDDLRRMHAIVGGKHILISRKHAYAKMTVPEWIVPIGHFKVTRELVQQFAQVHLLSNTPTSVEEVTNATDLIKKFIKQRDRVRSAVASCFRALRILKRVLLQYALKRRKIIDDCVAAWDRLEDERREALREKITEKFMKRRPLRSFKLEHLKQRKSLFEADEAAVYAKENIPLEDKREAVLNCYKRAYLRFHRQMKQWNAVNGPKCAALRARTLDVFGDILCLYEVYYRARIPEKPKYAFTAGIPEFEAEWKTIEKKRAAVKEMESRKAVEKQLKKRYKSLGLSTSIGDDEEEKDDEEQKAHHQVPSSEHKGVFDLTSIVSPRGGLGGDPLEDEPGQQETAPADGLVSPTQTYTKGLGSVWSIGELEMSTHHTSASRFGEMSFNSSEQFGAGASRTSTTQLLGDHSWMEQCPRESARRLRKSFIEVRETPPHGLKEDESIDDPPALNMTRVGIGLAGEVAGSDALVSEVDAGTGEQVALLFCGSVQSANVSSPNRPVGLSRMGTKTKLLLSIKEKKEREQRARPTSTEASAGTIISPRNQYEPFEIPDDPTSHHCFEGSTERVSPQQIRDMLHKMREVKQPPPKPFHLSRFPDLVMKDAASPDHDSARPWTTGSSQVDASAAVGARIQVPSIPSLVASLASTSPFGPLLSDQKAENEDHLPLGLLAAAGSTRVRRLLSGESATQSRGSITGAFLAPPSALKTSAGCEILPVPGNNGAPDGTAHLVLPPPSLITIFRRSQQESRDRRKSLTQSVPPTSPGRSSRAPMTARSTIPKDGHPLDRHVGCSSCHSPLSRAAVKSAASTDSWLPNPTHFRAPSAGKVVESIAARISQGSLGGSTTVTLVSAPVPRVPFTSPERNSSISVRRRQWLEGMKKKLERLGV